MALAHLHRRHGVAMIYLKVLQIREVVSRKRVEDCMVMPSAGEKTQE